MKIEQHKQRTLVLTPLGTRSRGRPKKRRSRMLRRIQRIWRWRIEDIMQWKGSDRTRRAYHWKHFVSFLLSTCWLIWLSNFCMLTVERHTYTHAHTGITWEYNIKYDFLYTYAPLNANWVASILVHSACKDALRYGWRIVRSTLYTWSQ